MRMPILDRLQAHWSKLSELARWLLFLPVLLLSWTIFNLAFQLALYADPWGWPGAVRILLSGFAAAASAAVFFPLLFFLAPRAQIILGWCAYSVFVLISVLVVLRAILMLIPGAAPEWAAWESKDWDELAQATAWLLIGTRSFRDSATQERARKGLCPPGMKGGTSCNQYQ